MKEEKSTVHFLYLWPVILSSKALKHFLKCPVGEDGESIELAIETVRTVSLLKFSVLRCILRPCCFVLDQTTATSSAVAYRSHNSFDVLSKYHLLIRVFWLVPVVLVCSCFLTGHICWLFRLVGQVMRCWHISWLTSLWERLTVYQR